MFLKISLYIYTLYFLLLACQEDVILIFPEGLPIIGRKVYTTGGDTAAAVSGGGEYVEFHGGNSSLKAVKTTRGGSSRATKGTHNVFDSSF